MGISHLTEHGKVVVPAGPVRLFVENPWDSIRIDPNKENKLQVQRVSSFYGEPDVIIIGKVVSGVITDKMKLKFGEQEVPILKMDSKYRTMGKEGMTIGITVRGVYKDDFQKDSCITFVQ